MSLQMVFDREKAQRIKQEMPVELIVYKVALVAQRKDPILRKKYRAYVSPICCSEYSDGEQTNQWNRGHFTVPITDQPDQQGTYYPGFHSFTQKEAALNYLQKFPKDASTLLTCGVLKDWITALGIEGDRDLIVVSNRILMPAYPHTDIHDDKNCNWFFQAQSKKSIISTLQKNKIPRLKNQITGEEL